MKFPRQHELVGSLIYRHFEGEIELDVLTLQYLLEADKAHAQKEIESLERAGFDYLLIDRYLLSGLAYGLARGLDFTWMVQLQRPLREPHLTIIFDITAEEALQRSQSQVQRDEQDVAFLEEVRTNFLGWEGMPGFHVIPANREPQAVHEETMRLLLPQHAPI